MNSKVKKVLIATVIVFTCYIFSFFLNCFISNDFKPSFNLSLLFAGRTFLIATVLCGAALVAWLSYEYKHFWLHRKKSMLESGHGETIVAGLENSYFQTQNEMNANFRRFEFKSLPVLRTTGVPINITDDGRGNSFVHLTKPMHALVIGTTGSGKTTMFITPTIKILSETRLKPSMVIADPKGELHELHSNDLKSKGYYVQILDLREPFFSSRWNPLESSYIKYQEMLNLPETEKTKKQVLFDEVYETLHDIVTAIAPVTSKDDQIWERGAQNFLLAVMLAMLEDSVLPERGMTKDKFNFFNVREIALKTENGCETLKRYFSNRSPSSKSRGLSKQVLDAKDKTLGSYLSTIQDKINAFADTSICALTSANEINLSAISDKPIAVFLKVPDEKSTRNSLASLFILQAYKAFVKQANQCPRQTLAKPVYFLLDEFGNLPPIPKIEQMITAGRSRNIWFLLVVQSYSQLTKVYDSLTAEIIKSNCPVQIFIGTNDVRTTEEFSKLCGNYSIVGSSVGFNSERANELSQNQNVLTRPLIYPSELAKLNRPGNNGNAIVSVFGYAPIRATLVPCYKSSAYKLAREKTNRYKMIYFDEEAIRYIFPKDTYSFVNFEHFETERLKQRISELSSPFLPPDKILLLSLIDKHCFSEAAEIIDELSFECSEADKVKISEVIKELHKLY